VGRGHQQRWEGGVLYEFDTAWSPSVRFVENVSRAWPTLVFVLDYEEIRAGYKGLARAQAGTLDDHCIGGICTSPPYLSL
jgi:hypothetical protein